jgi:hypothetical protein
MPIPLRVIGIATLAMLATAPSSGQVSITGPVSQSQELARLVLDNAPRPQTIQVVAPLPTALVLGAAKGAAPAVGYASPELYSHLRLARAALIGRIGENHALRALVEDEFPVGSGASVIAGTWAPGGPFVTEESGRQALVTALDFTQTVAALLRSTVDLTAVSQPGGAVVRVWPLRASQHVSQVQTRGRIGNLSRGVYAYEVVLAGHKQATGTVRLMLEKAPSLICQLNPTTSDATSACGLADGVPQ